MAIDFKKLAEKAVAQGTDMTKATTGGGGEYTPPPAGPCLCRLIAYIEIGKQKGTFKGVPNVKDKVLLVFELTSKNHPVVVLDDGTKLPTRITVELDKSLNEKSHFFKMFQRLNPTGEFKHFAELLGKGFKAEVIHDKWTGKDNKEHVTATFKGAAGYTVAPARVEDFEAEGGWRDLAVPPHISDLRCFLWDYADTEQWASLFIEGEYPERKNEKGEVIAKAKSKNVFQDRIKLATNFPGSPIHALLVATGGNLDIPDAEDGLEMGNDGQPTSNPTGASGTGAEAVANSTISRSSTDDALKGIV